MQTNFKFLKLPTNLSVIVSLYALLFPLNSSFAQSTTVYTPNGTPVTVLIFNEMSQSQIIATNAQAAAAFPNATIINDASTTYNCHAYAWYLTECTGCTNYWMNTPGDDKYWQDGSYIEISSTEAEKISYASDDHSAIESVVSGKYDSKWGQWPLMRHNPTYTPYNSSVLKYYKRNFTPPSISGPDIICSAGSPFTMNNLPSGSTITWSKSSNITMNSSQGSNPCNFSASGSGIGWIKATVSGYSTQKNLWAGPPSPNELDIQNSNYSGQDFFVAGEQNVLWVTTKTYAVDETVMGIDDYDWNYSSGWSHFETEDKDMVSVVFVPPYSYGYETVYVRAHNPCGEGNWHSESYQIMQNYYLSFYPNPTYGETTVSIEQGNPEETDQKSSSAETTFDKIGEWDLEIYDLMNVQKLKKDKLKSKSIKIQTAGWNEGIYIVRVKYKDEILTGKLLVTK